MSRDRGSANVSKLSQLAVPLVAFVFLGSLSLSSRRNWLDSPSLRRLPTRAAEHRTINASTTHLSIPQGKHVIGSIEIPATSAGIFKTWSRGYLTISGWAVAAS